MKIDLFRWRILANVPLTQTLYVRLFHSVCDFFRPPLLLILVYSHSLAAPLHTPSLGAFSPRAFYMTTSDPAWSKVMMQDASLSILHHLEDKSASGYCFMTISFWHTPTRSPFVLWERRTRRFGSACRWHGSGYHPWFKPLPTSIFTYFL